MKVLHVYRTYFPDPPGGLQEAIRQICLATRERGIENTIFTLSPNPVPLEISRPEGRVVRRKSWAAPASCDLGDLSACATFRGLADEADLIHYFFPWPFADLLRHCASSGKPAVLTYVSDIVRQRWLGAAYAPLMWNTLRGMKAIVAGAPAYVRTSPVLSNSSLADRVRVIPFGIDEQSYPQLGDDSVLQRLGIDGAEPYFLFIGVLRYYKGLHFLIQAADSVGAKVIVAGTGPEGEALRNQARQLGATNVIFAGQVTDAEKVTLLRNCRALALPSHLRSEAYGMVLVEAAMFGKPMVSCEIGTGTSFINTAGETGFVVPAESPLALAEAMNALLTDEQLAVAMGHAARRRYESLFSAKVMGQSYADLFSEVAAE
ncbi:MAG: glycosyltransferase [Gammaproteobacteria bacterium]|nr:glycosyltransferase [Gammaproteobacteria bacterium]MBU1415561.1 glycosyltransferase [Gammaproteobacteria bacterium]